MTDKEIKKYIDKLNKRKHSETIFLRPIGPCVYLAKVWPNAPKLSDHVNTGRPSYSFFFIKNQSDQFVAAVLDMHNDLHWFVKKEHRKQGHLTKALQSTIIPFLFEEETELIISIARGLGKVDYENSKKVATRLGFVPKNEEETRFHLLSENFERGYDYGFYRNVQIAPERIELLRRRASFVSKLIYQISDELRMAYDDDQGLSELAAEVSYFNHKIDDLSWKYSNKEN